MGPAAGNRKLATKAEPHSPRKLKYEDEDDHEDDWER